MASVPVSKVWVTVDPDAGVDRNLTKDRDPLTALAASKLSPR